MNYTTYLFDFDYTLADSSRGIVTCFRMVLTRHGYTEVTDEEIKRTIGKTLEDSFSILTGVTDPEQLAGFREEYRKEADIHMTVNTVLFLETKSVLVALKDSGARIGIISTKYRYRIKELLDQHFPINFMDIIVGGEDVQKAKPSPEGLILALKKLHATKSETLYIGDSTIDAETAQAAGVAFAGITHGVTTTKELSKYPHWKIMSSLEELLDGKEEKEQEQPSAIFKIEEPILPENASSTSKEKKMINIWQMLLLLFLFGLSCEEMKGTAKFLFPSLFILALWGISQKRKILPHKVTAYFAPWLHPFKVKLRAFRIGLIRGKAVAPNDNASCICQNCGTHYTGNYCNRCGQSRNTPRYRLSNALKNIAGGFFNIDSGFGLTLIDLLHRPGYMIRDFIGGKRIQYFRPFQSLFILAALYIMTVQLIDPEALTRKGQNATATQLTEVQRQLQKIDSQSQEELQATPVKNDSVLITATPQYNSDESLVDNLVNDGFQIIGKLEAFVQQSPFLMRVWNLLKSWAHGNKAFRIIATLPLFALATQLAFRRRKYNLNYNTTEHVFIQAYIACQILLLSIIVLPFYGHAQVNSLYELPSAVIFLLFWWDYKQLYSLTWWKSFWRTLRMFFYCLLLIIAFAMLSALLAIVGVYCIKPYIG